MFSPVKNIKSAAARAAVVLALLLTAAPRPANAQDPVLVDNGPFVTNNAWNATNFSIADDFAVTAPVSISSIRFWAIDSSGTQRFGGFSGNMSWFIHANTATNRPGDAVASGFSSAVVVQETGQSFPDSQDNILQIDFATSGFSLDSGTYWLRLKEGMPTERGDSSPLQWMVRDGHSGQALRIDFDPVTPTAWQNDGGTQDLAFQLLGPPDFETVETPEPGSFCLILLPFLLYMSTAWHRKKRFKRTPASAIETQLQRFALYVVPNIVGSPP